MKRILFFIILVFSTSFIHSQDLQTILEKGELVHLGINFANFNTAKSNGFCYEFINMFCDELKVEHKFYESDWNIIIEDLTGKKNGVVKGDLISTGMTILPWREDLVDFSDPIFPTQVLVVASLSSNMQTVKTSDFEQEYKDTVSQLKGNRVACLMGTSLDLAEYNIDRDGYEVVPFDGSVDDIIPAVIQGKADAGLVDIGDALIAMQRWPGKFKIIGPITDLQYIGVAFRKSSPELKDRFNQFYAESKQNGRYMELVQKYYPFMIEYYPEFFKECQRK